MTDRQYKPRFTLWLLVTFVCLSAYAATVFDGDKWEFIALAGYWAYGIDYVARPGALLVDNTKDS